MLVIGSSLEVYSAFRFVQYSNDNNIPIAIINFGETRAERKELNNIIYKSDADCNVLLESVINKMK
jgi:NAD-dependent SIR2 family protein deacetylase